ncbi:MAG TPA: ATP-grasp domain-containing protein [Methyloversatilis sp.]
MSHWLIISGNAHALARSCVRAGATCDVIDPYGDCDTAALARRLVRADTRDGGFDDDLPGRIAAMAGSWSGIVTGSGFERRPDLLDALRRYAPVVGNDARTTRRCKKPGDLSDGLRRAGAAFAPIAITGRAADGWLMKQVGACGGLHVRPAHGGELIGAGWYAQHRVAGIPASVLFLADGEDACIVGISRQRPGSVAGPYAWCEAVSDLPMDDAWRMALTRDIDAITREFGLRGLNGLDMVLGETGYTLLEINPRPTATLALYDDRVEGGLFAAHIAASKGLLADLRLMPDRTVRGLRVVWAPDDVQIGHGVHWPAWCTDLPAGGSRIGRAQPLCTVHAAAADPDAASVLLRDRERQMLDMFGLRSGQMMTTTVHS